MIERSYKRSFNESHFRQFLTIVPGFYVHKWEMINGKLALMIEIPADAGSQITNESLTLSQR